MAASQLPQRVGREIAALRRRSGMTQEQLAEKSKTFWTTISRIERGKASASLEVLERVAVALKVDVRDLLGAIPGTAVKDELMNDVLRELRPRTNPEIEMARDVLRRIFDTRR